MVLSKTRPSTGTSTSPSTAAFLMKRSPSTTKTRIIAIDSRAPLVHHNIQHLIWRAKHATNYNCKRTFIQRDLSKVIPTTLLPAVDNNQIDDTTTTTSIDSISIIPNQTTTPSSSSSSSSSSPQSISYELLKDIGSTDKIDAREKRKKLLRVAKAMDRGLPNVTTYNPCIIIPQSYMSNDNITDITDNPNDKNTISKLPPIISYVAKSGLPNRTKLFTVLGIESSCDDTGVAIVRSDGTILGEALIKQNEIHEQWGGIVPGLARDAHVKVIDSVIDTAMQNANLTSIQHDIDAIAVTVGPGLEICLRVGYQKASAMAQLYHKPFVGVHHLEAHILMARLPPTQPHKVQQLSSSSNASNVLQLVHYPATSNVHATTRTVGFPFLAMLVSGGHCQLIKCIGIGQYEILGGTLDDSLGEAYDKVARLLGLPVGGGGGPAVEQLAKKGDPKSIPFTLPMQTSNSLDFSYAGLKTNVRRACEQMVQKHNEKILQNKTAAVVENNNNVVTPFVERADQLPEEDRANIAASFQHIAIRHVEEKLKRAMTQWEKQYEGIHFNDHRSSTTSAAASLNVEFVNEQRQQPYTLALVGGVAANQELRTRIELLCQQRNKPWTMLVPPPRLCTDQGTYV
jgi:N6-L-threonylcarbamoyladenine synthase